MAQESNSLIQARSSPEVMSTDVLVPVNQFKDKIVDKQTVVKVLGGECNSEEQGNDSENHLETNTVTVFDDLFSNKGERNTKYGHTVDKNSDGIVYGVTYDKNIGLCLIFGLQASKGTASILSR